MVAHRETFADKCQPIKDMKKQPLTAKGMIALCMLALVWAQLFGASRGHICDCAGDVVMTTAGHCQMDLDAQHPLIPAQE